MRVIPAMTAMVLLLPAGSPQRANRPTLPDIDILLNLELLRFDRTIELRWRFRGAPQAECLVRQQRRFT